MRAVFLCLLLSFIGSAAFAENDVIVGDPTSCHLKIEYDAKDQMLHLRPTIPGGADCEITPLMVQTGLYQALDRQRHNADLRSIFLGRLADYHWLSNDLTERSRCSGRQLGFWDGEKGRALEGSTNAFVVAVLMDRLGRCREYKTPAMLRDFIGVLAEHGYGVISASAEKVLLLEVLPPGDEGLLPGGKFPYDALVHLRISKMP